MRRNIIFLFLYWHFVELTQFLIYLWSNIIFFVFHYFTISGLMKTLFWPYKRYQLYRSTPFQFGQFFGVVVFNTCSRLIGFLLRLITIVIGLIIELKILIIGSFIFLIIFFWPFILITILMQGIKLI